MPHIDSADLFGDFVTSLSLLSPCVMKFTHKDTGESKSLILTRRSMLVLTGESRYCYKHEISKESFEQGVFINGERGEVLRDRRVSLTFRYINDAC